MAYAAHRLPASAIADRFRLRLVGPPLGVLEERAVEVLGREAVLTVERVAAGLLRATVAVREGGAYLRAGTLGREVADAAHQVARAELDARGAAPTSAGIWGVGFTVDGAER